MDKTEMSALDRAEQNRNKIAALFPECLRETKNEKGEIKQVIDFDALKACLGQYAEEGEEAYEFTWAGKKAAMKEAQKPTTKTLCPCPEESIDWEHTRNLYIEGDNLEVLKILRESYLGKIDLIYIDPPYNTGNTFIYNDDFRHSDWCSMIYARLLAARDLLTEDGAIFISIDDNEVANLKKICGEVFGEENFVTMFTWVKTTNPPSLGSKVRDNIEYVLCYEKKFSSANKLYGRESNQKDSPLANATNRENEVTIPAGFCDFTNLTGGKVVPGKKDSGVMLLDEVTVKDHINTNDFRVVFRSKWSQSNIETEIAAGTRFVIKNSNYFSIRYIKGNIDYVVPDKFLHPDKFDVKDNEFGRKEVEELIGKVGFHYPKNTPLIETLLKMYLRNKKTGIVMDFFSGSATTAHALLKLNAEDNGERQFIMVQYPEKCAEKSEAKRAGYDTICDIGKARIARAAEKIKRETNADIDYGFRVFKTMERDVH